MKKMETIEAGADTDCTGEERLIKLGATAATGALGGPFGFLGGLVVGLAYDAYACGWK